MDAKPYSMKLVARLQPNQASGKIDRLPIPEDRQITYTRAKGGGGQGGGQGDENESPEPEE
jgi:hypothetical protein